MGRKKGPKWGYFDIVREVPKVEKGDPTVECLFCQHSYCAGESRIRAHILGDKPALGVITCDKADPHVIAVFTSGRGCSKGESHESANFRQTNASSNTKQATFMWHFSIVSCSSREGIPYYLQISPKCLNLYDCLIL